MTANAVNAHAEALIREIEEEAAREQQTIAAAAEKEAEAIVRHAFAEATRRVREEIGALRRESERRLARAEAQIETERRLRDQARAAEVLHIGCPELIHTVVGRWRDRDARRFWIDSMAADARRRLRPGPWIVEHPVEWTEEDEAELAAALPPAAVLTFRETDAFDAGFRIEADGASLDCTPERLLAERSANQARLLAEMNAELEAPSPPPAHGAAPRLEAAT